MGGGAPQTLRSPTWEDGVLTRRESTGVMGSFLRFRKLSRGCLEKELEGGVKLYCRRASGGCWGRFETVFSRGEGWRWPWREARVPPGEQEGEPGLGPVEGAILEVQTPEEQALETRG